ncbi:unnamed protein product [Strongylus vulgaris]|uniref:Uncharacterized protein n=1 Tax=Strongylus vulgaris TaxID=40348 RepID=A0A3P7JDE8_STRVU|nr:unnamed protein product [Strongylus vulgaris]
MDSSPDEPEVSTKSTMNPAALSIETKSSASGDIVAGTQELVAESDDEGHLRSELYEIDEITRLAPPSPSSEEEMEEEQDSSAEDDSSSDEDDTITRSSVAKMNLFGPARKFAEYILARRSERVMIKRDPNVATKTYEVKRTVRFVHLLTFIR